MRTIDEVIAEPRVSRAAFDRWRRRGGGPAVVRLPDGGVRVRDRRPFNPRTGLPDAETIEEEMITWYAHARAYAEAKWPARATCTCRRGDGEGSS